jgi:hypothetical protein
MALSRHSVETTIAIVVLQAFLRCAHIERVTTVALYESLLPHKIVLMVQVSSPTITVSFRQLPRAGLYFSQRVRCRFAAAVPKPWHGQSRRSWQAGHRQGDRQ